MKKLIDKLRKWLICRLGGVTIELHDDLLDHAMLRNIALANELGKVKDECSKLRDSIREICRRSPTTYYDWACDQCATPCSKRNGWCWRFEPR